MKYAYIVARTDGEDGERQVLTRGTRDLPDSLDERTFAGERCRETRAAHSYYTGPLRCSVWPHTAGEPLPRTAPQHAVCFDYDRN